GSTVSTEGGSLPVLIMGDANIDGGITLSDVSTILMSIAKWDVELDRAAADPDNNGNVNLSDVAAVLKHIAKWDVKLGYTKIVVDEAPQIAVNEDAGVELWFDHSTEKLTRDKVESTGNVTYTIYAAKNEIEDAIVYVSPDSDKKKVCASVTPFTNCYGDTVDTEVFTFMYHSLGEYGNMPDAMMPQESSYRPTVSAGTSQGFLVRAKTTADTAAGLYEAVVSIMDDNGEFKRAKAYLCVWDFTLDDSDAPKTSFGMSTPGTIGGLYGKSDTESCNALYKQYYDYLLENRINAFFLPYDAETPEADVYLNDPRVRAFCIYGGYNGTHATIDQVQQIYTKLSPNAEWFDKGYFYVVDEPGNEQKIQDMYTTKALIDQYYPGGKQVVPIENDAMIPVADRIYTILKETCGIWCPKMYAFTPESYRGIDGAKVFLTPEATAAYGTYDKIVAEQVEQNGVESWWYFAGMPFEPYSTFHADSKGILPRIQGWQMFQNDVTGLLYYAIDDYQARNPLYNLAYDNGAWIAWGNGVLIYPGARQGYMGPIGSVRMEYIRDGLEDYMYLTMAEQIAGEAAVAEILAKVSRDLLDYTTDTDVLLAARAELAGIILTATAK
ncbi:MAG: DUF4091 domain-containing protein, partial [Clostridia bacterium]|nr:DUF4091 domain-containing protein [Clostridia bacterium]